MKIILNTDVKEPFAWAKDTVLNGPESFCKPFLDDGTADVYPRKKKPKKQNPTTEKENK